MDVPEAVVARALQALDSRAPEEVLDLVGDSDLDPSAPVGRARRLRFRAAGCALDALVTERPPGGRLDVLVRLTPPRRTSVRAIGLGPELTVPTALGRTDHQGVTKLAAVPRGISALVVGDPADHPALRTAWVRL